MVRSYIYEQKLVNVLNAHNAKATFFGALPMLPTGQRSRRAQSMATTVRVLVRAVAPAYSGTDDCIYDRADSLQAAYKAGHVIGCAAAGWLSPVRGQTCAQLAYVVARRHHHAQQGAAQAGDAKGAIVSLVTEMC
jgi:peptidoglycan/xylan/chitin deacetylase (PgdA/CDA1 family)